MLISRAFLTRLSALAAFAILAFAPQAEGYSRVKDLVEVEGIRDNMLVGYGLVVGLNGTGDSLKNAPFTQQSHPDHAGAAGRQHPRRDDADQERRRRDGDGQPARLRRQGTRIDVSVSAMGDAKNLQGGTLLVTTAVRRRRPDLCARPGPRRDRRLLRARARPPASRAACRRRGASPTAPSWKARPASRWPA